MRNVYLSMKQERYYELIKNFVNHGGNKLSKKKRAKKRLLESNPSSSAKKP